MAQELKFYDYEDRLFYIIDGSRGFVWQNDQWQPIQPEFAGRVWASGAEPRDMELQFGYDRWTDPEPPTD